MVDLSKLRRRSLGTPPTDGSPGIEGEGKQAIEAITEQSTFAAVASRSDEGARSLRRRAPAPDVEPRVPFTSRITVTTKERLEEACYNLRVKHQQFVDEAIRIHLTETAFSVLAFVSMFANRLTSLLLGM